MTVPLSQRLKDLDGFGHKDLLFCDTVVPAKMGICLDNVIGQFVKVLDQFHAFSDLTHWPVFKVLVHVDVLARPCKNLSIRVLKVDSGLGTAPAAEACFALWHRLIVFLTT